MAHFDAPDYETATSWRVLSQVLSREEIAAMLKQLSGTIRLVVMLLYGSGVRLEECLELRIKDIEFDRHQIIVRRGKGERDRMTLLPAAAREALTGHLAGVRRLHEMHLARGFGRVVLPFALDRKFPNATMEWQWQFEFRRPGSAGLPNSGCRRGIICTNRWCRRRWPRAAQSAAVTKRVGPHVMRHSFATHLLEDRYDIRTRRFAVY